MIYTKKCLVYNYWALAQNGGIETDIYNSAKYMVEHGIRVLWLCTNPDLMAPSFVDLFKSGKVEIYKLNNKGLNWFKYDDIPFKEDEQTVIVSFSPSGMAFSISLKQRYNNCNISLYYKVPNTTGCSLFLERYFPMPVKNIVLKKMRCIIKKWDKNGCLRFFDTNHAIAIEKNYDIHIESKEEKRGKGYVLPIVYNNDIVINRSKRDKFDIISVGRFDFPHKNYILGLIEIFSKLKEDYPYLSLTLIGDGSLKDRDLLNATIKKLPPEHQYDIKLMGVVPFAELGHYFDKSHLSIGVAGGAFAGLAYGIPTLIARNYSDNGCEVYGYFTNENFPKATSLEPGMEAETFIREVITMQRDEYIELSQKCYDTYKRRHSYEPMYFFNIKSNSDAIVSQSDVVFIKYINLYSRFVEKIWALWGKKP